MKHIGVYLRTSKDNTDRFSIETQKKTTLRQIELLHQTGMLKEYKEVEQALASVRFYIDENWSGIEKDRPEMKRLMLDALTGNIYAIIVYSIDRLTRSIGYGFITVDELRSHGVKLFSYDNFGIDFAHIDNESILNEHLRHANAELEKLKRRTRMSRATAINSGKGFPPGFAPLGYKRTNLFNSSKQYYEIDEPHAEVVRIIFRMFLNKHSIKSIVDYFKKIEYRKDTLCFLGGMTITARKDVTYQFVRRCLERPIYAGYLYKKDDQNRSTDELVKITLEEFTPIIDINQFNEAQKELSLRKRTPKKKRVYILDGLLKCSVCGNEISVKSDNSTSYICRTKAKSSTKCDSSQMSAKKLEDKIYGECIDRLDEILADNKSDVLILTNRIMHRSFQKSIIGKVTNESKRKTSKKQGKEEYPNNTILSHTVTLMDLLKKYQTDRARIETMRRDDDIDEGLYIELRKELDIKIREASQKLRENMSFKEYAPDHPFYVSSKKEMMLVIYRFRKLMEDYFDDKLAIATLEHRNYMHDLIKMTTSEIIVSSLNDVSITFYEDNELYEGYQVASVKEPSSK